MARSSDDGRFAVFDFEEDLLLHSIDIFDDDVKEVDSALRTECLKLKEENGSVFFPANDVPCGGVEASGSLNALAREPLEIPQEEEEACPLINDPTLHISDKLQRCVQVMTSKVDQLQQEVLQITRTRSILKRAKLQRNNSSKDTDLGSLASKKPRLLDAARTEPAKRKKMSDLLRLCGTILRQLMQHKWAWPFVKPVDVEGLQLHDYYKVIRRPMDLGTIRRRLEAKDGMGYRHVRELSEDVRLVFRNAMLYNESWTEVHFMAKALLQKFEDRWKVAIEPRLLEEDEKAHEDQQDKILSDISELHAREEQAAEQLCEDVFLQLTNVESKMEGFVMQILSKCRAMQVEEKKDLYLKLCNLPCASFNRVVEILKNAPDAASDNISVDLEVLDTMTLWRLHFFVKMIMEAANEQQLVEKKPETGCTGGPSDAAKPS